jgi:hypothetical protein
MGMSELAAVCLAFALAAHIYFLHKERQRNQRYYKMIEQSSASFESLLTSFNSLKETNATLQAIIDKENA